MKEFQDSREPQHHVICPECVKSGIVPDPRKEPYNLDPKYVTECLCNLHQLASPTPLPQN